MEIAGADLLLLSSLSDKLSAGRDAEGRFHVHELLRQFAGDLAAVGGRGDETAGNALAYYLRWMTGLLQDVLGSHQVEAVRKFGGEKENVLTALHYALDSGCLRESRT